MLRIFCLLTERPRAHRAEAHVRRPPGDREAVQPAGRRPGPGGEDGGGQAGGHQAAAAEGEEGARQLLPRPCGEKEKTVGVLLFWV